MIGWRAKKGKLRRKFQKAVRAELHDEQRGPRVPKSTGKQAANGSVPGFRGSQKDNGHAPNGGPGGSARRFRPPARRGQPALGPRAQWGDAGPQPLADIFFCCLPARLCSPGSPHSPRRHRPPETRSHTKRPPKRKRTLKRFSSKKTLLGRRGRPARAAHSLALTLGPDPTLGRPALPRGAWGRAHRSPAPEAAGAVTTPRSRVRPGPGATGFAAVAPRRVRAAQLAVAAAIAR